MKEIKFRFRLKLVVEQWGKYKKGDIDTFIISLDSLCRVPIDKQWEILSRDQFTGQQDKNGKDIYQSDFIQCGNDVMLVNWNEKYASFCLKKKGWLFSHWFGESCDAKDCEIVGNIYDNPEKLK